MSTHSDAETAAQDRESKDIDGLITDEDIERARSQVGIPVPARDASYTAVPDRSSMSHFAFGYGDDNPLWHDPAHGAASRWRGQIAPPLFPVSAGVNETPRFVDPEMKKRFRGLFRGVGKYYSGVTWEWYRPIYSGDDLYFDTCTSDLTVRQSSFSKGRSVVETYRTLYVNRVGEPVAVRHESYVSAERGGSKEAGKYAHIERQRYTPDEIEAIDAAYAGEQRRGSEPNWWEDVIVGEPLIPVVKGPLTVVDIIAMHQGMGWGGYAIGPLRYGWAKRMKMPAFYVLDEYGVPDVVQRLHWDQQRAEELGLPAPYDYGQMRTCWLSHLVTNWMGDDAWLWRLSSEVRRFNFMGDTHWCTGEVTAKRMEGEHCVVDLEIRATSQRGEVTTPGLATVILPSRVNGPVTLPKPPAELAQRGGEMAAESAARRQLGTG